MLLDGSTVLPSPTALHWPTNGLWRVDSHSLRFERSDPSQPPEPVPVDKLNIKLPCKVDGLASEPRGVRHD